MLHDSADLPWYCGASTALRAWFNTYIPIHTYLSVVVASLGAILNATNMIILRKPTMSTANNAALSAIAFLDVAKNALHVVYAVQFNIVAKNPSCHEQGDVRTKAWAYFIYFYSFITVNIHSVSLWMAVYMTLTRYLAIRNNRPITKHQWFVNRTSCWIACTVAISVVLIANMNGYLLYTVKERPISENWQCVLNGSLQNGTMYTVDLDQELYTSLLNDYGYNMFKATYLIVALMFKILPCTLLCILSLLIIRHLCQISSRRRTTSNLSMSTSRARERSRVHDRTTILVILIIVVFLVNELPQGILALGCAIYGMDFYANFYVFLGDTLDIMSLLYSVVSFGLYCTMSAQFRDEFCATFCFTATGEDFTTSGDQFSMMQRITSVRNSQRSFKSVRELVENSATSARENVFALDRIETIQTFQRDSVDNSLLHTDDVFL